jgi:hypothetical protein
VVRSADAAAAHLAALVVPGQWHSLALGKGRGTASHRVGAWQALLARELQKLVFFQRILAGADFSGARFAALRLVSYTAFGHIHARTRDLICNRYLKPGCAREGLAETLGRGLVRAKAVREARRPTGQRGALGTNVAGCALPHT